MNLRIEELSKIISDAIDEIARIREACPHTSRSPGYWSWRIGVREYRMICDACGHPGEQIREDQPSTINTTVRTYVAAE